MVEKIKKWCREAAEWVSDVVKIVKGAKDIKENYDKLKDQNHHPPSNPQYIDPNLRMDDLKPNRSGVL